MPKKNGFRYRRARACPSPCCDRGGQAPALRGRQKKNARGTGPRATVAGAARFIVGRGPVPRRATIAGDRPTRYVYFVFFTAPNVVSIRLEAETGPGNNRVTNVSRFPSNATSSI